MCRSKIKLIRWVAIDLDGVSGVFDQVRDEITAVLWVLGIQLRKTKRVDGGCRESNGAIHVAQSHL